MFQPEVKLEFVRRYCPPMAGWQVVVDIDASEEGRTGGERKTAPAREQQALMVRDAARVRAALIALGVTIGGSRKPWFLQRGIPPVDGDRDVVAIHAATKRVVIAEVEGASTGQPEQKLYKAIGQLVVAASVPVPADWKRYLVLVAHGDAIGVHLARAGVLSEIGIAGLSLALDAERDQWHFGMSLPTADDRPEGMVIGQSHAGSEHPAP